MTKLVGDAISLQYKQLGHQQQIIFYKLFGNLPSVGGMASYLFAVHCHSRFASEISLRLHRMVLVPKATLTSSHQNNLDHAAGSNQWHSSHVSLDNRKLETVREAILCQAQSITINPLTVVPIHIDKINSRPKLTSGTYYMLRKKNREAIDSFILDEGFLYIFQFTRGGKHDIKEDLLSFFHA